MSGAFRWLSTAMLLAVPILPAMAASQPKAGDPTPSLLYFLPKNDVDIILSQRLLQCPTLTAEAKIATTISITQKTTADFKAPVLLDLSSGWGSNRSLKLTLNPDGTLAGINNENVGQVGKFLSSVLKFAVEAASTLLPIASATVAPGAPTPQAVPKPEHLRCRPEQSRALARLATVTSEIGELEGRVLLDKATPASIALLDTRRTERNALINSLTQRRTTNLDTTATTGQVFSAVDYGKWFEMSTRRNATPEDLSAAKLPAVSGFVAKLTVDADAKAALCPDGCTPATRTPATPTTNLVYRRPVPAKLLIEPNEADKAAAALTSEAMVLLPQLSKDFTLPLSRAKKFGSSQQAMTFDASGAPVMVQLGKVGAAGDASAALDTATAAIATLRDAELDELNRQIALETARLKLNELRAGSN